MTTITKDLAEGQLAMSKFLDKLTDAFIQLQDRVETLEKIIATQK